jgi:hypothetical protein
VKRYVGQYEGQQYEGQQYVGIDLHRCRSVVVRMTDAGELLEAVQITNSPCEHALGAPVGGSRRSSTAG